VVKYWVLSHKIEQIMKKSPADPKLERKGQALLAVNLALTIIIGSCEAYTSF
jgi:hypothetical protein